MPYVEVWVDYERLSGDELEAIRRLFKVAIEMAAAHWPNKDARELESAALDVGRNVLMEVPQSADLPIDKRYRKWLAERGNAQREA